MLPSTRPSAASLADRGLPPYPTSDETLYMTRAEINGLWYLEAHEDTQAAAIRQIVQNSYGGPGAVAMMESAAEAMRPKWAAKACSEPSKHPLIGYEMPASLVSYPSGRDVSGMTMEQIHAEWFKMQSEPEARVSVRLFVFNRCGLVARQLMDDILEKEKEKSTPATPPKAMTQTPTSSSRSAAARSTLVRL